MGLTIISYSSSPFKDRSEAGIQLGSELHKRIKEKPLILGIPRGGMVTASAISSELNCDIDIILTHKIRAPFQPELAIGAIGEDGRVFLNDVLAENTGASQAYLKNEKAQQLEELKRRRELFRSIYPKIPLKNRVVVITDDGVATGATVQAAFWAARLENPHKLIGAFPVAPPHTLEELSDDADEIICLKAPEEFYAISQFYLNFRQVSDDDVLSILKEEYGWKQKGDKKCVHH